MSSSTYEPRPVDPNETQHGPGSGIVKTEPDEPACVPCAPSDSAAPDVSLKEQWEAIKEMAAYAEMEWGETSDTGEKGWWESLSRRLRAAEAKLRDVEALREYVPDILLIFGDLEGGSAEGERRMKRASALLSRLAESGADTEKR